MEKTDPSPSRASGGASPAREARASRVPNDAEAAFEALAAGGLRGGSATAWELFDRAWGRILERLGVFVRSLRVPDDLREDCAQLTLTRAWRGRASYRGATRAELLAWLHRICEREFLRLVEGEARAPRRVSDLGGGAERAPDLEPSVGDTTALAVESRDRHRALEECIAALEDLQRRAVELLYSAVPCTEREAATILDISKSYVNVVRRKSLDALESCLRGKGAVE